MMRIFDTGVLIIGEPRSGKSTLALGLLDRGHHFVGDDGIEITVRKKQLIANAPIKLFGLLHIYELGILNVPLLYGNQVICNEQVIHLIIQLSTQPVSNPEIHLNGNLSLHALCKISISKLTLSVSHPRPICLLVEKFVQEWQTKSSMSSLENNEKKKINLSNKLGLHARATVQLINLANQFKSEILIEYQGRQVNAKSILCVMALGAPFGAEIELSAEGNDEQEAIETLTRLINNKFGESQ